MAARAEIVEWKKQLREKDEQIETLQKTWDQSEQESTRRTNVTLQDHINRIMALEGEVSG
jgi:uncharacterized protein YlxW (UPF0749 family)